MNYRMQCSCGHSVYRAADTREEAIDKFKSLMTQEALDQHFSRYHPAGEQKPTLAELHAALAQMVMPADEALHLSLPALVKTA